MSVSRQFAQIGVPPRTNKPRKRPAAAAALVTVTAAPAAKKQRSSTGAQIPRGFVTALAADSKFIELTTDATKVLDTTGTVTHLDIIPQGDTVSARTGKSFQLTNFQIRGMMANNAASVISHVAVYLVWDRQPNKAIAVVGDFLETSGSASATAFAKRENKGRFLCIKKWQRVLIGQGTAGVPVTGREALVIDKWIKLPQECVAQCTAADTTGVIGNRITGALLLVTIGNVAAGTAASLLTYRYRIGFKDPN